MVAEASLRQAQRMEAVGQLTGGIAHDLNSMLQAIAGSLELMRRRIPRGATEEAERHVEVAVADTGAGMDEATRARMFEPFFTTEPLGQGTGLGPSQLYGFVRQSYGVVRPDSAPGRGTIVRLYLPRHGQAGARDAEGRGSETGAGPEPDGVGAGSETVLLVDDEAGVRAVVAEHPARAGLRGRGGRGRPPPRAKGQTRTDTCRAAFAP